MLAEESLDILQGIDERRCSVYGALIQVVIDCTFDVRLSLSRRCDTAWNHAAPATRMRSRIRSK